MKNNKGFSLVELIVVIAIMAILAAIAIPTFAHFISKAEQASDDQLLHDINYVFDAACLENGVDPDAIVAADWDQANLTVKNIKADGVAIDAEKIAASFVAAFDVKNPEFKVITGIVFDARLHEFVDASSGTVNLYYKGSIIVVDTDKINTLKDSDLGKLGAETLLGEAAGVVSWATGNLSGGPQFNQALNRYLGLESDASEEERAAAIMKLAGNDSALASQIYSNAIALYAAEKSESVTKEQVRTLLNTGSLASVQGAGDGETLAQVSAIYCTFMAYQKDGFDRDGDGTYEGEQEGDSDALLVIDQAFKSSDYKKWANGEDGEREINAYLASMSVVAQSAKDPKTASAVLVGGFSDPELVELMKSLIG